MKFARGHTVLRYRYINEYYEGYIPNKQTNEKKK
jgi:hypothetical protein